MRRFHNFSRGFFTGIIRYRHIVNGGGFTGASRDLDPLPPPNIEESYIVKRFFKSINNASFKRHYFPNASAEKCLKSATVHWKTLFMRTARFQGDVFDSVSQYPFSLL